MNFKLKLGMFALCSALMFSAGCKKDETENPSNPSNPSNPTVPPVSTNKLCDGNGTNAFMPIVQQNRWEWKQQGSGNVVHTWKLNGTQVIDSKTYQVMNVVWDSGFTETDWYFRVAADGTVYRYANSTEYVYLPAAPTLNQQWTYPSVGAQAGQGFRKVTALNKTLSTSSCSYTGLMEIKEYSSATNVNTTYYYKKGLGIVRFNSLVNSDLRAVTLN